MRRERVFVSLGLALLVAAAFSGAVHGEFLAYDDDFYVTANPLVLGGLRPGSALAAFEVFQAGNWHPLTWISHMLDVSLFGVAPAGHHATSVALHAANAVLAFVALAELTGTTWRAALAAALFALHPLRVESVAWIAERKDVLAACFGLSALWAWTKFARGGSRAGYVASLALFAASLLSKPTLVTFPFLLLVLDRWPLARLGSWSDLGPRLLEKAPFFALSLVSCGVTLAAQAAGVMRVPLELRLENAVLAYAEYLRRAFWPAGLAAMYPYPESIAAPVWLGSLALVSAITGVCIVQARRRPWLLTGWLWFAGMLVPTLGLVQVGVQAFADRYTYFPFLGLALAASFALAEVCGRARVAKAVAAGAAALVLVALAWQTRAQVRTWHDTVSVFQHALEVTRDNWFAHTELGVALAARGELDAAKRELEAALEIRPDLPRAQGNLGVVLVRSGSVDAGLEHLDRALALDPNLAGAHLARGMALEGAGRLGEAEAAYRAALGDPRSASEARLRLARLRASGQGASP